MARRGLCGSDCRLVSPKAEVPTSKNAMMHIDRDVVGIFVHKRNKFFALDLIELYVRELRCRIRAISMQQRATGSRSSLARLIPSGNVLFAA
jgi:hypothetical protein